MALEKIKKFSGTAVHVPGNDIDTDRIIPARYMKCVTFDGLGQYAFYDERFDGNGKEKKHPLNTQPFKNAPVLLSGANFGCGSSREHAPQSLYFWGIRAVIAESFAEIFFGNSTTLGIPCVCAKEEDITEISKIINKNPLEIVTIDVEGLKVTVAGKEFRVTMPKSAHYALINGSWDLIGELADNPDAVDVIAKKLYYV
jgi:3-isopropylmalate/(R)-2-methylmalate dehydratase small subunit